MFGTLLPSLKTAVPGPESRLAVDVLASHECPAVTARRSRRAESLGANNDDPIVWRAAAGANVEDVDGNRFVDLTSGFGVALVGHRHPDVVAAANAQAQTLVHAMGDAWPDQTRIRLLAALARVAPEGIDVAILGLSGADAVDAAVKTAILATGRTGILTFDRGYHGLSLGTVALQGYNPAFTEPFRAIAHPDVTHLPWGCELSLLDRALKDKPGLVLAEPIQGRGGIRTAPEGWLEAVAQRTRAAGALFALDEIQTGIGRTGTWFAGPAEGVVPDLLCVGKALGGGFPISACMGTRAIMNSWGRSTGEALHTQTFLGHPVGCATALAVLSLLENGMLDAVRERGAQLTRVLADWEVRGRGLMRAIRVHAPALAVSRALLRRGYITLPADAESISLTPPVTLNDTQIHGFRIALLESLEEAS
jgi:4-aminobutyrate aminotransferase / (S)-3-amino-2-methylpropionate transaminase / 5-aminovalerate transaminase